ncbi:MAG: hypothetical protein ABI665_04555 [Vicinamibacterales bacterium]
MTNAHTYYRGFLFPHTRRDARLLVTIELLLVAPWFGWQMVRVPARPLIDFAPVVLIAVTALVFTYRALRHLERLEREHAEPTPVMSFLLQLAVMLPLMAWVTIGDLLAAYRH